MKKKYDKGTGASFYMQYLKENKDEDYKIKNNRKNNILCQYFPEEKFGRFGVVSTWEDTLVCYVPVGGNIKAALDIAVSEVLSFIEGKISESEFLKMLDERETIMKALMFQNNIPNDGLLYMRLFEHYVKAEGGYKPYE